MAGVVLATTVPLSLLQVPYAALPQLASTAGTSAQVGGSAAVLRAASLALPFAVAFAPLAALAIRRFRALPVLIAGLIAIVAGDVLTGASAATATGSSAAVGGALHGIAAGLTIVATVALVAERAAASRRLLAAWWAAVMVGALAVLPGLTLGQHPVSGWRTALGPVPWLTISAIVAVMVYPLFAARPRPTGPLIANSGAPSSPASAAPRPDGYQADSVDVPAGAPRQVGLRVIINDPTPAPRPVKPRQSRWFGPTGEGRVTRPVTSPAERLPLALLVPPAAALSVVAVAATYRPADTIIVAAVCGMAALLVMAALAVRGAARAGFGVTCAVIGFALAPTSTALAGLRTLAAAGTTHGTDGTPLAAAAVAGAIAGAGIGFLTSRSAARGVTTVTSTVSLVPAAGLLMAAAALVAGSIAGPFSGPALLGVLAAVVTGGLSAALARSAGRVTAAGGMAGVVVLAAAAQAGYLTAGAIRAQLAGVTAIAARGTSPVPHPLVTATGWWELLAAAAAVAVACTACARRARAVRTAHTARTVRTVPAVRARATHARAGRAGGTGETREAPDTPRPVHG